MAKINNSSKEKAYAVALSFRLYLELHSIPIASQPLKSAQHNVQLMT